MTELKRLNVHRIVETPEEANKLIAEGFKVVGKVALPEQPADAAPAEPTETEEAPPEKPAKAK